MKPEKEWLKSQIDYFDAEDTSIQEAVFEMKARLRELEAAEANTPTEPDWDEICVKCNQPLKFHRQVSIKGLCQEAQIPNACPTEDDEGWLDTVFTQKHEPQKTAESVCVESGETPVDRHGKMCESESFYNASLGVEEPNDFSLRSLIDAEIVKKIQSMSTSEFVEFLEELNK
jgi:hypothetical protein